MRENYNYNPDIEEIDCNMNTGLIAPKSAAPRKTYFGTPDQAIRYNSKAADTAINKILAAQGDQKARNKFLKKQGRFVEELLKLFKVVYNRSMKNCFNCQQNFEVLDSDRAFYE